MLCMRRLLVTAGLLIVVPVALIVGAMPALPVSAAEQPYAERVADEHAGETPAANIEAGYEGVEVGGRDYATLDGEPVRGYLARPTEGRSPYPAVLLVHEWWGLNDNIRAMARGLAQAGYVALAVDLYEGETADNAERARALMQRALEHEDRLERNLEQAFFYLDLMPSTERIGTIGWCFGGGWALRTALMFPEELDAAVIYYGELVTDPERLARLEVPILGIFGSEDAVVDPERVREFDRVLTELDKPHEIHLYEGAGHAFANPTGETWAPDAAAGAWQETLEFLDRHLKEGD